MFNKKIKLGILIFTFSSIAISTPFIAIQYINKKDVNSNKIKYDFSYIFGEKYKKSKLSNIDVKDISYNDLTSLPENLNSHFGYDIISGGFGELRQYYKKPTDQNVNDRKSIHLGLDVIIPKNNNIYSPFDAQVINSIWIKSKKESIAYGSGGNITLKVKLENLNVKDELKELLYFKSYKETSNAHYPGGKRIESFYFTQPKLQFANFGKYKAPTNESLQGYNKSKITVATKSDYENFINSYTEKQVWNSSKNTLEKQKIDIKFLEFLKESPKYIYITIMHLSRESLNIWGETALFPNRSNLIYYSKKINGEKKFQNIKKGDKIGFIGDKNENGGWISHIHLETFTTSLNPSAYFDSESLFKWETNNRYYRYPNGKGVLSVYSERPNATQNYLEKNNYESFEQFAQSRSIINSNNIFQFYKKDSNLIKLKKTT